MSEPDPVKDEPVAREPLFRAPKVVLIVIAILVAVHVAIQLGGQNWQIWSLYAFSFIPARVSGAIHSTLARRASNAASRLSLIAFAFGRASADT